MASCHEMKKGDVYVCKKCGLELKVVEQCKNFGISEKDHDHACCNFVCCEKEMVIKK